LGGGEMVDTKKMLQSTIVEIWKNEIKYDYDNNFIINEDTLKVSFCYHLRNKLTDSFLLENNLRIITELEIKKLNYRVDIAIVKVHEEREKFFHYSEYIDSVLVLIELKFLPIKYSNNFNQMLLQGDFKKFDTDLFKLMDYGKVFDKTLLFGAFIHEYYYNHKAGMHRLFDVSQFFEKEILERVTELNGFNSGESNNFVARVY
jgi:hypothetical protein